MYIDLGILIVVLILLVMFNRRFSSFVFGVGMVDLFLRIFTLIKNNIGLSDVSAVIDKYIPESIISIIAKYTSGIIFTVLCWFFITIMIVFLFYVARIFFSKKKF